MLGKYSLNFSSQAYFEVEKTEKIFSYIYAGPEIMWLTYFFMQFWVTTAHRAFGLGWIKDAHVAFATSTRRSPTSNGKIIK